MEDLLNESISDNDIGENEELENDAAESGDGSEENVGGGTPDDAETSGGDASDSVSDTVSEGVGGNDTPTDVGDMLPDALQQAVDGLSAVAETLEGGLPDYGGLADSVRSLVDILTVQAQAAQGNVIPVAGYRDFDYPITVTWEVHPSAPNAPSRMESVESFDTPEAFESRYDEMCNLVGVSLNYFRILRIRDCSDEEYVYDADNVEEEPEEPETPEDGEQEEDTFQEDVLASLAVLHEDLQTISMNDLEYRDNQMQFQEQYTAMQEQLADMQELNTDLQYHLLATNVVIGFTLLLTLGYTVAHGFLQRMKVG